MRKKFEANLYSRRYRLTVYNSNNTRIHLRESVNIPVSTEVNKEQFCGSAVVILLIRFQFWIRIQGFDVQKWKILPLTKIHNFQIKNCNLFIPKAQWRAFKLQEKSRHSKENTQHFKTVLFFTFFFLCMPFLPTWFQIRNQPTKFNADPNRHRWVEGNIFLSDR